MTFTDKELDTIVAALAVAYATYCEDICAHALLPPERSLEGTFRALRQRAASLSERIELER